MVTIYGLGKIEKYKNPVVALGVFDGVHRGHRKILKEAVKKACDIGGKSIVLTFSPHPQKQESLYSLQHRLKLISELDIDICIVVNFTKKFAQMSAEDFISKVLVAKIRPKFIFVGRNFRFGKGARGDYKMLEDKSRDYNFKLKIFNVLKSADKAISSTLIRKLIKSSRIREAGALLGRRVAILGTVGRGSGLGKFLGFPTANINPHHEIIPAAGIYAVKIILSGKTYNGACYIGTRPTISTLNKENRIEVHIFNFHKDIYGKTVEVQFLKLIRADKKFSSLAGLASQIRKDIVSCRKIHNI